MTERMHRLDGPRSIAQQTSIRKIWPGICARCLCSAGAAHRACLCAVAARNDAEKILRTRSIRLCASGGGHVEAPEWEGQSLKSCSADGLRSRRRKAAADEEYV